MVRQIAETKMQMQAEPPEPERNFWLGIWGKIQPQKNDKLANTMLLLAIIMVLGQLWVVQRQIKNSGLSDEGPVTYPDRWQPDKQIYHPGDVIRFRYTRVSKVDHTLILSLDSFENLNTSEVYPGTMLGRDVEREGTEQLLGVRFIPEKIRPGRYVLNGWVSAQTSRRSLPTVYRSLPFTVEASK